MQRDGHCSIAYNSEKLEQSPKYPPIQNWLSISYTYTMKCHVVITNYNRIWIDNERYRKLIAQVAKHHSQYNAIFLDKIGCMFIMDA